MTIFYSADLHFYHRRANELCGRPWDSVEAMNEGLIERWNSVVKPGDQAFILGDFCFQLGTPGHLEIVQRLNGVKTLMAGNHDNCHRMFGERKSSEWRDRYFRAGFDDVITEPFMRRLIGGVHWVWLSHFPYEGDSHDEDRFREWRLADQGLWVIHGHTHGKWLQRRRQIDVGVDANNGFPVPEEDLVSRIYAGPADVPPKEWQAA